MQSTAPECPACGAPLRLTTSLTPIGPARDWVCTDSTCPTIIPEAALQGERGDLLGASIPDLMQASATPKRGGSSGGSRGRQKPRKVTAYRRERRYLDQDCPPAGPGDRAPAEARKPVLARVPLPLAAWLEQAAVRAGLSQSAILEAALQALADSTWCTVCDLPGLPGGGCIGGCRPSPD